jgi:hypothetical protein
MTLLPGALALILVAAQTPVPDPQCTIHYGVIDVIGAPVRLDGIAAGTPVALAPGSVLAAETFQIATRMWRAAEPIALPAYRFTYPAGTRVTALMSPRGLERCLRDSRPPATRGPGGRDVIPCLLDADGDGRYEAADIATTNMIIPFVGTRPRFRPIRRVRLGAPVSLVEDPQGIGSSRQRLHRRLRVVGVAGDRIEVAAEQALQNAPALVEYPLGGGAPRPLPPDPVQWRSAGASRSVALAEGGTERIGGVAFRFARGPSGGWAATPLDPAFPEWIEQRCSGTSVATRPVRL